MRPLLLFAIAASLPAQDKQMALGEQLAREFRKTAIPVPGAEPYVRGLAKRLTPPGTHWEVEVMKHDFGGSTREPVTYPGYMFVPARLILMTGSEAELAGMLAHAVAHMMEPPARFSVDYSGADIVPLGRVGAERARELAADRRAAGIAAAAGYDPQALIDYLRRVQPESSPKNSRVPPLAERIAAIEEGDAAAGGHTEWKESTAAFADAQEIVRQYGLPGPQRKPSLFRH
jgi:hypothetical protein